MIRRFLLSVLAAASLVFAGTAVADPILFEYGINVDGDLNPAAGVDISGYDDLLSGLGIIEVVVGGVGSHTVLGFFDIELEEVTNTFYNEIGGVNGIAAAGQTWEIDEPGWAFGDIYDNFADSGSVSSYSLLDNLIFDGFMSTIDDVSIALGWDFFLGADETATIAFSTSQTAPDSGFYLEQIDTNSEESIFYYSSLIIEGDGPVTVPEPGTLWLLGAGLLALGLSRRRITKH